MTVNRSCMHKSSCPSVLRYSTTSKIVIVQVSSLRSRTRQCLMWLAEIRSPHARPCGGSTGRETSKGVRVALSLQHLKMCYRHRVLLPELTSVTVCNRKSAVFNFKGCCRESGSAHISNTAKKVCFEIECFVYQPSLFLCENCYQ